VGAPIEAAGRANREAVTDLTARLTVALEELVADAPDVPEPGRFGRWVTERFNDWPEGSRAAAEAAIQAYSDPSDRPQE
jgi:hypothetical protein